MLWTSVDCLPEEGVECLLSCMQADGSFVELIGYYAGWGVANRDRPARTSACARSTLDAAGVGSEDRLINLRGSSAQQFLASPIG